MPVPLQFLLQEGKVRGLEESYENWKQEHDEAMQAHDLETLVDECNGLASDTERFWNRLWADLNRGQSVDVETLGKFVDRFFARVIRFLADVKEYAAQLAPGMGHRIAGLDSLERATKELQDLHGRIKANWPWESRPWPPLNREMQQRSRSGSEGPGEEVGDILRRIQAGGSIVAG